MNKTTYSKWLKHFQKEFQLNYIIDPQIDYDRIPLPYRNRMFLPKKRKKNDPIGFELVLGRVVALYE